MSERQQPVFEVQAASWSRAPGVSVRGEVDIGTAAQLTEALDAAIRESVGAFVIDLADVVFLDSSGINVLMRARALLGREDRPLMVVCQPGQVRRVLDLAGIADLFALFDSREQAAGSLQPAHCPGLGSPVPPAGSRNGSSQLNGPLVTPTHAELDHG